MEVKWNSKNKKRYEQLGYVFTKLGDSLLVSVDDLSNGSNYRVTVQCDYCGRIYQVVYYSYVKIRKTRIIEKDCCNSPDCIKRKVEDTIKYKYGTNNVSKIEAVTKKRCESNIKKYGCSNPFGNEDVQRKIRDTNLRKYGCQYSMQSDQCKEKYKATCLSKYGVSNHMLLDKYKKMYAGEKSPKWKGGIGSRPTTRECPELRDWRRLVFERDHFTCIRCGVTGGCLNAHHIKNWSEFENLRYDVQNGITLCSTCHKLFHKTFGKTHNDEKQLYAFLDQKVC